MLERHFPEAAAEDKKKVKKVRKAILEDLYGNPPRLKWNTQSTMEEYLDNSIAIIGVNDLSHRGLRRKKYEDLD